MSKEYRPLSPLWIATNYSLKKGNKTWAVFSSENAIDEHELIAVLTGTTTDGTSEQRAKRIIHCVNHFDEMLAALKFSASRTKHSCNVEYGHGPNLETCVLCKMLSAIAKAEGRES